ncbi:MAG: glucosaminidase domain-containing protein [Paenibacillaceae bacterium]|nr:glucosaminidase domain-containing protein [Paenibacillaceae bacterium]
MNRQEFIDLMVPGAQEVQLQSGMFASVTIAQAIWETGTGASIPVDRDTGECSYNLFGRKAAAVEPYVTAKTWEVYDFVPGDAISSEKRPDGKYKVWIWARFRKFNSYTESVMDRTSFLTLPWYRKACEASNPFDAARFLIDTGYPGYSYATDPNYADGIISVINSAHLTRYDLPKRGTEEEEEMIKVLEYDDWAWRELDDWVGEAYNDSIIEDWKWVQLVRDKKLQYKDLLLLKVLIDERRRVAVTSASPPETRAAIRRPVG